jgi:peptide/nickel transport system substrate-binding protein
VASLRATNGRITRRGLLRHGAAGALAVGLLGTPDLALPAFAQGGGRRGGTLRAGLDADPPNLDPHRSSAAVDRQVFQSLFDKLMDTDENLKIVPMLATSWSVSQDGRTYTFKLRQGVQFHDGTPFNAQAVVYNFSRMRDPKFPSARRSEIGPVTDVVASDPSTVQIKLERPYSPLPYILTDRAGMMVSPAAAEKDPLNFALHPVGSGPFSFVEKIPQDHITLKRNANYWMKGLPYLDQVTFRPVVDDNARVASLKSGDLDIINLVPAPQVPQIAQDAKQPGAGFRLMEHGAFSYNGIWFNMTKPPFDNKALRQAFDAALDRTAVANAVLRGAAYPAYSFFPNGTPAYDPTWKVPPRNVGLAKEKLQAGGHATGFDCTLLIAQGQTNAAIAQAVQSMVGDVGIKATIQVVEFGTLLDTMSKFQHQAGMIGWSGRPDPDFDIYPFVTKSGIPDFNYAGYVNDQVQNLLDAARVLQVMNQRVRAYSQVTKILADDMPYAWLYFLKEYKLVSTKVRGFVQVPDGMMRFHSVSLAS